MDSGVKGALVAAITLSFLGVAPWWLPQFLEATSDWKTADRSEGQVSSGLAQSEVQVPDGVEVPFGEMTLMQQVRQADSGARAYRSLIDRTIEMERVDRDWAPRAAIALQAAFSSAAMSGYEVIETDCRTTLCRVDLWVDSDRLAVGDGYQRLVRVAPWSGHSFFLISKDPRYAVFYLSREGDTLPLPDRQ